MVKVDIISGFLGAGKTTFIKKLISEVFTDEKIILIENEYGEIGIDGGFLQDTGIEITEMNSGCICCTLVGDFAVALQDVIKQYNPDRVIIEPSGVGKLSDVEKAIVDVKDRDSLGISIDGKITIVDGKKAKMYMNNFGEFFNNQVESANVVVLSRTQMMNDSEIEECMDLVRQHNEKANIVTTPWDDMDRDAVLNAVTDFDSENELLEEVIREQLKHDEHHHHHHHHDHDHHHHHDHDHDEHCECDEHEHHHHHDHDEHGHDEEHEHHHHHDHDHDEHEHHHHDNDHDHGEGCSCGCGHHHHHHDHDADEVFDSYGAETVKTFDRDELDEMLEILADGSQYGVILRAKGVVKGSDCWYEFDLVPGEYEIRERNADYTGKVVVIGTGLEEDKLDRFFR